MATDARGYREEVGLVCCWTCVYRVLGSGTPRVHCGYPSLRALQEAVTPIGVCNWYERAKGAFDVRDLRDELRHA
jgi:hypothetical protein